MSPADAKRGAKRRKNKRGGGLGSTGGPGPSGGGGGAGGLSKSGAASASAALRAPAQAVAATPSVVGGLLTAPATAPGNGALSGGAGGAGAGHGEVSLNGTQFTDGSVGSEFTGVSQSQDFLLHMPLGNSGSQQESVGGGRITVGAQTVPSADLSNSSPSDVACNCEACNERREISAETERESQQLQNYWSEVRYMVRCVYRQAGTPLADDQDQSLVPDKEGMKELVDRLCERDPYQLYQRLEQQAREYVLEMKVRLLRHLSLGSKVASTLSIPGPPQAHQFISLLLEEYSALCQAACTISTFLVTLENEHLKKFQVTWELHNKHLFENLVFSEPLLQNSLPTLVSQLRLGTTHDSCSEDMYSTLLQRYHQLEQEMCQVAEAWLECQKKIDDYVDEQMAMKTKQRMLKEDWEFFKQRRFIEEQLNNKKALAGENNFTDTMRHMLSSRLSMPDCPNCNYRRRCTCDDCSLSHILTCGIMDSPITDDIHINQLPLQIDSAPDYLSEIRPPSMSSASSESGSSSPITIQQHPRLILTDNGSAPTFGSDDEDVAPLSAKFADIYPLNNYDDAEVVANMNGIHSELNGGGENMALKDESPQVSSTSSSSSEADDEEADGESSGEPPGTQKEEISLGKRTLRKDEAKMDSPPPSYPSQQADQGPNTCECHVCKQEASGVTASALAAGRLPAGHQFVNPEKPAHPALHLYPHIHGHVPLHTIPHLPRPLIHPTLYTASPFTHNKALPPAPVQNHTNKHQVFNASLQDHIYPSCFGSTPDWNSSKFISLWESEMMNDKNWNPATFLPDTLPGSDLLAPALSEIRPEALPTTSSNEATAVIDSKEKKNAAKKKCLYNFQDAFMETNKVVMATSSATSSVSCTATTVQSSSNQFKVSSKRPSSIGEVFHNINKEDHRHSAPVAPRNSPTSLASLPSLSPAALSPAATPHIPNLAAPSFPKTAAIAPGFVDPHSGLCPSTVAPPTSTTNSSVSAPPSVCSDPDCEGHRCENSNTYDHQQYDGEESQDEDSCSEHSSSTSTSTNQKEGKYCDCCYCEFFGHGGPPAAPTSRNYAEMREKLRLRLTKRKEEQPKKPDQISERESVVDHRKVEDLLQFINSSETKPVSSSRAAKRARHKQRKLEEKARLEAEAKEREHHQLIQEQRRREEEEEERLKQELQRLQELQQLQAVKKKKKDRTSKDCQKMEMLTRDCQAVKESIPNIPEDIQNGILEQSEKVETSSSSLSRHVNHMEQRPIPEMVCELSDPTNTRDSKLLFQKEMNVKQHEPLSFLFDIMHHHKEGNSKQKLKQVNKPCAEQVKKPAESPKATEIQSKTRNQIESKVKEAELPQLAEPKKEEKKTSSNNNKKQLNHVKEEKTPVVSESPSPSEQQQNNKLILAESPQPKGKNKKNKKKKGDKVNNSIDDVFLPKDIDLDSVEMDETEREVEYFKRFCLDSARQTRQRLSINWSNFSLKKTTFAAH
ncbi:protein FAM193A isoform X3 [Dermochelys coriacea]|uniref:protein FAM193A isoform X3 n=1 Tax=Dermochelys coriacea TaxID=27794 RepID=UPI0018E8ACAE|nr:protein FAM193A isoform X3 [Dermochelys coriacea]